MQTHHIPPALEVELAYRREDALRRRQVTESGLDGARRGSWFTRRRRAH